MPGADVILGQSGKGYGGSTSPSSYTDAFTRLRSAITPTVRSPSPPLSSRPDRSVQLATGTQATFFPGSQLSTVNNQPLVTSTSTGQPFTLGNTQSFGGNGSTGLGAGQGPGTQSTGQASDNPFNNSFFFQIPQAGASPGGPTATPATTGGTGYSQYLPLIVVGVIVAGIGYYAFGRKK